MNEGEWRDSECQYKARQTDTTDGGLCIDTGIYMNEVMMNERVWIEQMKMKTSASSSSPPPPPAAAAAGCMYVYTAYI